MSSRRDQAGLALISALVVVTVLVATVLPLAARQQAELARVAAALARDEARLDELALEQQALAALAQDASQGATDTVQEDWAALEFEHRSPRSAARGRLYDLQGLFNINNLYASPAFALGAPRPAPDGDRDPAVEAPAPADPPPTDAAGFTAARASELADRLARRMPGARGAMAIDPQAEQQFRLLLQILDIDPSLGQAVLDWIDPDTDARFPNGAEDEYYLGMDPPYRAANGPIVDLSELRLVKGMTPEILDRLRPFVVALPLPTRVNVNTAPKEVLMSLGPAIDAGVAALLISARDVQPFMRSADFLRHPVLAGRPAQTAAVAVGSEWLLLRATLEVDGSALPVQSLLRRGGNAGGGAVVRRAYGG